MASDIFPVAKTSAAIVVGASGGVGAALADAFAQRGFLAVHRLSRHSDPAIDLTDPHSISESLEVALAGPAISHVIIATGLLHDGVQGPEKSLRDIDAAWMARQFAINAIGPALVLAHLLPRMPRQNVVKVAALGARVGSIGDNRLGGWYGYRASKAALHQIIRTAAIEWGRTHKQGTLVALHPGTVATRLSAPFARADSGKALLEPSESAAALLTVLDAVTSQQTGRIFDWTGAEITP